MQVCTGSIQYNLSNTPHSRHAEHSIARVHSNSKNLAVCTAINIFGMLAGTAALELCVWSLLLTAHTVVRFNHAGNSVSECVRMFPFATRAESTDLHLRAAVPRARAAATAAARWASMFAKSCLRAWGVVIRTVPCGGEQAREKGGEGGSDHPPEFILQVRSSCALEGNRKRNCMLTSLSASDTGCVASAACAPAPLSTPSMSTSLAEHSPVTSGSQPQCHVHGSWIFRPHPL